MASYKTHNVYLQSADVNVLIIQFPDEAVNDKLAPLAAERGLIYKSFYEDFVVGTCLADSSPFFYHVRRRPELLTKFSEIWEEVLGRIYGFSPGFKPENIVINSNNILKTKKSISKDETTRPLEKNDFWNKTAPSSWTKVKPTAPPKEPERNPFRDHDDLDGSDFFDTDDSSSGKKEEGRDIHDTLPYELVGHLWETLGLYINIRQYSDDRDTLVKLIGSATFKSEHSYHLLVTQRCLEDWSDVIALLEQMGTTTKMTPQKIMEELYSIILLYNPFLKLEKIDAPTLRKAFRALKRDNPSPPRRTIKKMSSNASKKVKVEQTNTFEDIPKSKLLKLDEEMRKKVVGQDEALTAVVDAIQRASVGLKREHEPLGVFMFTGNSGVGKTETARALAECLNAHLTKIDCQDFQQSHEVAKLTGSPAGYIGHDEGGYLTNALIKYPFSVVLFDEIEKAHSAFQERLLQIIDDGVLTDNKGNEVSFKNAIIVMTSNIGVAEVERIGRTVGFGNVAERSDKKAAGARKEALKNKFKPEFINRIDEIVHFRLLEKEDYLHILDILLNEVGDQIKKSQSITLKFSAPAKNFLLDKGIDKKFGARPLRRAVKKYVNTPLARAILSEDLDEGAKVSIGFNKNEEKLTFRTAGKRVVKDDEETVQV